jgi:hypothetical protein
MLSPSATSRSSRVRIGRLPIDIFSLYVFPRDGDDGRHREDHEQDLEDAPDREMTLSNSFFVGKRILIDLSIDS